jgi:hypothetical protein
LKPLLLHGGAGEPPTVPHDAILHTMDTRGWKTSPVDNTADLTLRLKAIPPETLAALREATAAHQTSRPETAHQENSALKVQWSRAQVAKQLLLHSPHYRPAGRHAHRASIEEEHRMVKWAAHGAITLEDATHRDEDRMITAAEFCAKWPALAAEAHVYEEIRAALPREWTRAIRGNTTSDQIGEEAWWRDRHGAYWRHSTDEPEEEEEAVERMAQRYEREADSPRLAATGAPMRAVHAPPTAEMHQCCAAQVKLNPNASADWTGGNAKALRRARDEKWSHMLMAATLHTAHEPLQELGYRPRGLRERQVVAADTMGNKHVREMLAAAQPQLPRAWDCRERDERYARWYPGLAPMDYTTRVSRLFQDAQHPCVPPHIHDVLYRILVRACELTLTRC